MNSLMHYGNDTLSNDQINTVISLIFLMSSHFLVNSFTLVSDMKLVTAKSFLDIGSKYYLKMGYKKSFENNNLKEDRNKGFIVLEKPGFDFSKVMSSSPKLIAAIYKSDETNDAVAKLSKLVIPASVFFFIIVLKGDHKRFEWSDIEITARCFRLYKPISNMPLQTFPIMFYGGPNEPRWFWETEKTDWNFFEKKTRNMTGVFVTIALVSQYEREKAIKDFWKHKNSFFWRAMKEHLHFRSIVHVQSVSSTAVKSITSIYITLLMTVADGLGVLPVISSDRDQHLEFLVTGLDSKYHILVRTPQYVHSWHFIFKPLAFESWICLGIVIFLITVTLRIVTYCQNFLTNLSSCCLMVFGFVCFQGSTNIPKSLSARLVCYTALLFSILIYQFYTSNFYSLLSTKEVSLPFTSLEQFIAKRSHMLYVHPDTAIYTHIMKAQNGTFKKLWDDFFKNDPSHQLTPETRGKSFNRVCKGTGAILGLPFQTIRIKELQCKLVPVNSGYFPTNIVTVVRKNFPFKSQFKFVHLRLLEAGISHKFKKEHLDLEQQREVKSDVINEPVTLEHVIFLFAFHLASIILSWLVLGLEIITSKHFKGKKTKKNDFH